MRSNLWYFNALTFAFALVVYAAGAVTVTVTSTADNGPGTFRAALAAATDGDTIDATSASGTIRLTSGELLVSKSVAILGPGPANLAVDGNATGRVFHVGPGVTVSICGCTVTNGAATGSFPANVGGGIYNDGAAVTLSHCSLSANSATSLGGAIYNSGRYGSATLEIADCKVIGNVVGEFGGGGGIFNDALLGSATLVISNTIISGNSAGYEGGGIDTYGYGGVSSVTVINSTISSNSVTHYYGGGGVFNNGEAGTAILLIVKSTLNGNRAPGNGGAIDNDGGYGGNVTVQAVQSTISGNSSGARGGVLFNYGYFGSASATMVNSTLSDNSGVVGGGIFSYGEGGSATLDIGSTVLKAGTLGVNVTNGFGTVTSRGYNLSSDDGGGYLSQPTDILNTDPLLGPLQDNGGLTLTHALLRGSPAIDRGKNFSNSATDQRGSGFARSYDDTSLPNAVGGDGTDIGAFEMQPPPCTTVVTTTADSGPGSLRAALACAADGDTIDATSVSGIILLTSGELLVNRSVTILGPGPANLAVNGNGTNRVFHVSSNTVVTLGGLTLTHGYGEPFGGGILNDHATLTVNNCVVAGNGAAFGGAGIWNEGETSRSASLTVVNCAVSGNDGNAIYNAGGFGGSASLLIVHSTLQDNRADRGGAVFNDAAFDGNATLRIVDTTLHGNSAQDMGGGIYNEGYAGNTSVGLTNCTLVGNTAGAAGGGIYNDDPDNRGRLFVFNSTLSSNSAAFQAGGIYNKIGLSLVANCTFNGNSAGQGGGIYNDAGGVAIGGTILKAGASGKTLGGDLITSGGYNLSSDDGGGFLTAGVTDHINTDPMLGPLRDNGGPTFTHALLPGSPALDQGYRFGLTSDQRGKTRPYDFSEIANAINGDGSDIGAVEMQPEDIETPAVRISKLIRLVQGFGLMPGIENSLVVKLQAAASAIGRGNIQAACGSLGAFVNEASAQKEKKLPATQAKLLIADAELIRAEMHCP